MQYTIRDVPPAVDAAIRRRARTAGASLNRVVNDALAEGAGVGRERVLRRLLQEEGVHLLLADDQTTFHYASVFHQLRQQGTPIPASDIWIAVLVPEHNLVLHARDEHFDHLPQLPRA
jgi:predicted nucleic acid-binding protein